MALYICTWFCADAPGEESTYQQMRGKSSSDDFQAVYWRNIYLFYVSSLKVNATAKHVLFTNSKLPIVDGLSMVYALQELNVEIINVDFTYRTPEGYYNAWRNQFFEFSIFDYIAKNRPGNDHWLLLDSDCVFTKSVEKLPGLADQQNGILTYKLSEPAGKLINGITREDMQQLYGELLDQPVSALPVYHAGEFFMASTVWVQRLSADFKSLWPVLLQRHNEKKKVLTEEAHVLSFLYFKYNIPVEATANGLIKRLWTQPFIYRNVDADDDKYAIWHIPHEKRYGLKNIYRQVIRKPLKYWLQMNQEQFVKLLRYQLTIPTIHPMIYLTRLLPVQTARIVYYGAKRLVK